MSPQKIPEKTFEISELNYPIAMFGPDPLWVKEASAALQKLNPNSVFLKTAPVGLIIKSEQMVEENQYLPNLCVITKPIEMYLELIAINWRDKKLKIIIRDQHNIAKGWIILNFNQIPL